jgi:acetolactate synthase-1/2/3 large subunit
MYGQMAKWVAQIDRADRMPEYIARAFQIATSGRPARWYWPCRRIC